MTTGKEMCELISTKVAEHTGVHIPAEEYWKYSHTGELWKVCTCYRQLLQEGVDDEYWRRVCHLMLRHFFPDKDFGEDVNRRIDECENSPGVQRERPDTTAWEPGLFGEIRWHSGWMFGYMYDKWAVT